MPTITITNWNPNPELRSTVNAETINNPPPITVTNEMGSTVSLYPTDFTRLFTYVIEDEFGAKLSFTYDVINTLPTIRIDKYSKTIGPLTTLHNPLPRIKITEFYGNLRSVKTLHKITIIDENKVTEVIDIQVLVTSPIITIIDAFNLPSQLYIGAFTPLSTNLAAEHNQVKAINAFEFCNADAIKPESDQQPVKIEPTEIDRHTIASFPLAHDPEVLQSSETTADTISKEARTSLHANQLENYIKSETCDYISRFEGPEPIMADIEAALEEKFGAVSKNSCWDEDNEALPTNTSNIDSKDAITAQFLQTFGSGDPWEDDDEDIAPLPIVPMAIDCNDSLLTTITQSVFVTDETLPVTTIQTTITSVHITTTSVTTTTDSPDMLDVEKAMAKFNFAQTMRMPEGYWRYDVYTCKEIYHPCDGKRISYQARKKRLVKSLGNIVERAFEE